ncbi:MULTISPECIES: proteasome ATPase [Brevibacterium]|jgi:proteasome-associated ATPase|uniref:AAA ATPase forming ring-shaped complexes n=1 Tax=Brevibacterium salitolerans TaxID=1403566 RepID=A0ABN2WGC8_9MICO|nr:proteasome ATPase [Brevibacterium sp.]
MTQETVDEAVRLRRENAMMRQQLVAAGKRNETLTKTLRGAREELTRIKEEVAALSEPPNTFGTVLSAPRGSGEARTVEVLASGRRMRLAAAPEVESSALVPGAEVRLSEGLVVIDAASGRGVGDVAPVRELLPDGERVLVGGPNDEELVYRLTDALRTRGVRVGDAVLVDRRTQFAFEVVDKPEVQTLLLEEIPSISYADIGGLAAQIGQIKDAVEMPFEHPELFTEHGLKPPKGILLYGPPGCGKTLIAKAVAHSLSSRRKDPHAKSYFINVKGPELLDKYVGETERQLRIIFARAREKATAGSPVVVFFDEMESLFRTRGTGKSSDVETTIVPQLLAEIDGVEKLENVIVIGASNREDLIDPAILRPGRLDVKIRIERPDPEGAKDIFSKYVTEALPYREELRDLGIPGLIERIVERMFARTPENEFVRVTYADGTREVLHYADFASGAMVSNIVDRAKKHAIKDLLATGVRGLGWEHFDRAVAEEFAEHEDLPNTSNPDEWARISGRKGARIVELETVQHD